MADLLVKLYTLPESGGLYSALKEKGVEIKRAIGPEKIAVAGWVQANFSKAWASEAEVAFSQNPPGIFIAVKNGRMLGFACYDSTARGFFGPIGVAEGERAGGLGKGLLLRTLEAMREAGYGYAIVGWAGPVDFFKKTVGASVIEDSEPGVYKNMVRDQLSDD
ncbi:MAG: GNAT family N-acetyltransferase [Elusimicrobia bacterium GWC2_51_8]|nr:MAG: GNAT family N-acetyltransferase [Elusimicrobia bacterium GWA2_51_34]OGR60494.1 MAG: GNAT family N-acetyltransferase [Elusimicrobia bacterium GWC2_51_8]HAF94653.1 GNAT family N-acetyltransferase [Elusimicrobiota bacterium]HCE97932.1 GNAT family N-acetyltransferase [Elusimicrobiota bacterium]